MGFRCPKCKKDFDLDREALLNHFKENEDCTAEAVNQYAKAMNKSLSNDDALSENQVHSQQDKSIGGTPSLTSNNDETADTIQSEDSGVKDGK